MYVCAESTQHIARNLSITAHSLRTLWTRNSDEYITPTRLVPEGITTNLSKVRLHVLVQACISEEKEKVQFNASSFALRMQAGEFQGVRHHINRLKGGITIDGPSDASEWAVGRHGELLVDAGDSIGQQVRERWKK